MKKNIKLALETGIYGGSICLLKNDEQVSSWIGESEQTKSKEFPEAIKRLLDHSQISIKEIVEIVVSLGPGSYTGLRIGFSIAKGLKTALGINIRGVSLLDEMLKEARPITLAVLPFSKTEVCWKAGADKSVDTKILQNSVNYSSKIDFVNVIKRLKPDHLILPLKLHMELSESLIFSRDSLNIIQFGENLACFIGRSKQNLICNEEIRIFYPKPFKLEWK